MMFSRWMVGLCAVGAVGCSGVSGQASNGASNGAAVTSTGDERLPLVVSGGVCLTDSAGGIRGALVFLYDDNIPHAIDPNVANTNWDHMAYPTPGSSYEPIALSDNAGSFAFYGFPEGDYLLRAFVMPSDPGGIRDIATGDSYCSPSTDNPNNCLPCDGSNTSGCLGEIAFHYSATPHTWGVGPEIIKATPDSGLAPAAACDAQSANFPENRATFAPYLERDANGNWVNVDPHATP